MADDALNRDVEAPYASHTWIWEVVGDVLIDSKLLGIVRRHDSVRCFELRIQMC